MHFRGSTLGGSAGRTFVAAAAPGMPYQTGVAEAAGNGEVVIECRRGIPFTLSVVDEERRPVEAEVLYVDVQPSCCVVEDEVHSPINSAARQAGGTYAGYVLPGPGAVLVKTASRLGYRPAHVDPKAFFAPGRTNWTREERFLAFGTHYSLSSYMGVDLDTAYRGGGVGVDQRYYAAIVLVNPSAHSGPLELSATVVRDRPRQVSLFDPDGKPVVGAQAKCDNWFEPRLRAASFPLTRLNPDRDERITFVLEDRRLIGFLAARSDDNYPYIVRMQPWGTVTGRLLDENGKPISGGVSLANAFPIEHADAGDLPHVSIDGEGRFRAERLIPGLHYSARVHRGTRNVQGRIVRLVGGIAFENLVIGPGEVRDLGDYRTKPPVDEDSGANPEK
ncbi:MAG TPA: hypothetical protein VGG30_03815 [Pirellulales bacterium]